MRSSSRVAPVLLGALLALGSLGACEAPAPHAGRVRRVIDGDTIELTSGVRVRYLGIDAPEVRRRVGERWVVAPEPYGPEATDANRRLVAGRTVQLEYDVKTRDRFGRLLAYVYVDGRMVNAALVKDGYAVPLTIPPNGRHAQLLEDSARQAREARRGLWGEERP